MGRHGTGKQIELAIKSGLTDRISHHTYLGQHITRVSPESRSSGSIVAGFFHVALASSSRLESVVVVVETLKTPDKLAGLSPSRAATPTVAHPDGQYRPGE